MKQQRGYILHMYSYIFLCINGLSPQRRIRATVEGVKTFLLHFDFSLTVKNENEWNIHLTSTLFLTFQLCSQYFFLDSHNVKGKSSCSHVLMSLLLHCTGLQYSCILQVFLYSSVDAPSGAHWTETRAPLTWWESPQRALHIQQHLVVVLVILSLNSLYKKKDPKQKTVRLTCLHRWEKWRYYLPCEVSERVGGGVLILI